MPKAWRCRKPFRTNLDRPKFAGMSDARAQNGELRLISPRLGLSFGAVGDRELQTVAIANRRRRQVVRLHTTSGASVAAVSSSFHRLAL